MYKPLVIKVTRRIPFETKKTLVAMDKTKHFELQQRVLEYCKEPRNLNEIKKILELDTTIESVRRYFLNPLLRAGKLKYAHSYTKHSRQRYLNAEIKITSEMIEEIRLRSKTVQERQQMILEFCKVPKSIKEIIKHIGTTSAMKYVKPLMKEGKIKYTMPHIPYYLNQKYINAEIDYEVLSEEGIIEFCKTPRTKKEIVEHFNLTPALRRSILKNLIVKERLSYTEESLALNEFDGNRRVISNNG